MTDLPVSDKIRMRPVWARYLRRAEGHDLWPPTDEEKSDAIVVLRDEPVGSDLHDEAWDIFIEATGGPPPGYRHCGDGHVLPSFPVAEWWTEFDGLPPR